MKTWFSFFVTVLLLGLCSCREQHSKVFQEMQKDIENLETQIQETNDCDDLQLLTFSVLGLRTDLEKLQEEEDASEAEITAMTDAIDKLDASLTGKYIALNCNQANGDESEIDTFGEGEYEEGSVY